jgi:hypothetical protein
MKVLSAFLQHANFYMSESTSQSADLKGNESLGMTGL